MGTSAIHFLDLFQFLAGNSPIETLIFEATEFIKSNRRNGSYEIFGEFSGTLKNGVKISIASCNFPKDNFLIDVFLDDGEVQINEIENKISYTRDYENEKGFECLYVSETTALLVNQIYEDVKIDLTTFCDSSEQHLHLLRAINLYNKDIMQALT